MDFISGDAAVTDTGTDTDTDTTTDTGTATDTETTTDTGTEAGDDSGAEVIALTADAGTPEEQGWTVTGATVTTTANTVESEGEELAANVFSIAREADTVWSIAHEATSGSNILVNGGEFFCRFRITDAEAVDGRYALGFYWVPSAVPDGVTFNRTGEGLTPSLLNLYVHTDSSGNMNLSMHCATTADNNLQLVTIGEFDNNWHSIALSYHGGTTSRATLSVDGTNAGDLTLTCAPSTLDTDSLMLSGITSADVYQVEVESLWVTVSEAAEAA